TAPSILFKPLKRICFKILARPRLAHLPCAGKDGASLRTSVGPRRTPPMLRILGNRQKLCDGLSRRDLLNVGSLATLGLTLGDFFQLRSAIAAEAPSSPQGGGFGKAKACILLFLYGSPSQLETFDVKPDAPEEVRGTLGTISTSVPGYRVGELLPHL